MNRVCKCDGGDAFKSACAWRQMESKQGQNLTDQIHNMVAMEMYCHPGFGTRIFAKLCNLKLSSWSIKVFVVIT